MHTDERSALFALYRSGYDAVIAALEGVSAADIDLSAPGEWSTRQIAHHLADSESISYVRLRKLIAEEHTIIYAYDENEWASKHWYQGPIDQSLAVFKAVRESSYTLIESLSEAQWQRSGWHNEAGHYTMDYWLRAYAEHPHDHADQIRRARRGYKP
jgi:DinB superfamily